MSGVTAQGVAEWMLSQVMEQGYLYQQTAVWDIEKRFGEEFVYQNENGNQAIASNVLAAFRKLSEDSVVWERSGRNWRKRVARDEPGRRQW